MTVKEERQIKTAEEFIKRIKKADSEMEFIVAELLKRGHSKDDAEAAADYTLNRCIEA
jgi:hypothetical protein